MCMRIDFLQVYPWCASERPYIIIREQWHIVELGMYSRPPNTQKIIITDRLRKGNIKTTLKTFYQMMWYPSQVLYNGFLGPLSTSQHMQYFLNMSVFADEKKWSLEVKCLPKVMACKCWSWNLSLGHLAPNFMLLIPALCYLSKEPFHSNILQESLFLFLSIFYW